MPPNEFATVAVAPPGDRTTMAAPQLASDRSSTHVELGDAVRPPGSSPPAPSSGSIRVARVLIVDDDPAVLRAHARAISTHGYRVDTALDGEAAMRAVREASYDVILSDIDMPGMNGLEFLDRIRTIDLDVPVVLVTGTPSVETAMNGMERGALRYLVKPVDVGTLVSVTDNAVRMHRLARAKRQALELAGGLDRFVGDRAGLAVSFDRALASLHVAYQPIVSSSGRTVFAYEALLRSKEPSLPHPGAVLDAAERLGRVHELGRLIRARAIEPLARMDDGALLFLNLHPSDLLDEELFSPVSPLSEVANRIVLEITERASLDSVGDVRARIAALRELGFRIAIDDLGAGYAGLTSLALLEPDVVKLDMALVRDIHKEPTKQTLVRTMISMSKELGILVTGEGVETTEERDALARAGCDLMQGYLFARPGEAFARPVF
jgi:EAL domain-containing protein (putative c-di-GMP-specific phosphodiesterase class I)/ActR/RegA family two-component response regulator